MKAFAKIALTVALIAVIVLSIVVASVAWFTSNPEVDANDVTLDAARTLTVSFSGLDQGADGIYEGQIGNVASGDEAPFVYKAGGFRVNLNTLSSDSHFGRIKVEFGTVTITTKVPGMETISGILITDLFHVTADVYTADAEGGYVKDATTGQFRAYVAAEDSGADRYAQAFSGLTVADNGILMHPGTNGLTAALFGEAVYEVAFAYTFLPEEAYQVWAAAAALDPTSTTPIADVYGYELALFGSGDYIGIVTYTPYKAKYHYGLTRYSRSDEPVNGNYVYTVSDSGDYVRVVNDHVHESLVTKYTSAAGAGQGAQNGTYIKVGDSGEYVLFSRYNQKVGFPYHEIKYDGETFTFKVLCTVEEVTAAQVAAEEASE